MMPLAWIYLLHQPCCSHLGHIKEKKLKEHFYQRPSQDSEREIVLDGRQEVFFPF